ncbi:MAG: hypothetical protein PHE50_06775, partial [Dehalococcoidales bacterium]|nr:hypothetical protein [Dehalococcoidales bacterium]
MVRKSTLRKMTQEAKALAKIRNELQSITRRLNTRITAIMEVEKIARVDSFRATEVTLPKTLTDDWNDWSQLIKDLESLNPA